MRVLFPVSVILVIIATIYFLMQEAASTSNNSAPPPVTHIATVATSSIAIPPPPTPTSTPIATTTKPAATSTKKLASKPIIKPVATSTPAGQVQRFELPYSTPAQSFTALDTQARAALVNILCMPHGGTLRPISGSGVIIDPRGVILTNAHVAQYVLLAESSKVDLDCTIKTGSPATAHWRANVLYIPPIWVNDHYQEINTAHAVGTGEHDYALLLVTSDTKGNQVSGSFPYLPVDSRENVAFAGDNVLGAGYPAEFVGGIAAEQGLYAVTSVSSIKQLMTFKTSSIDVLSIGGVIEAQGGSSGGPVVNAWGYVVGIISTTSEGATTADRDLHALSLNYIDRDIFAQTGHGLATVLDSNLSQQAVDFSRETAPALVQKYVDYLTH